jgi:hypothetical protein
MFEVPSSAWSRRFFSSHRLYSSVDWTDFDSIIDAYDLRIREWYLEPGKQLSANVHFAFTLMALDSLLIDTLSQFVYGLGSGSRSKFIDFIKTWLPPRYSATLGTPIRHPGAKQPLKSVAEVIYYAFRCGVLHQAHLPPYAGVAPNHRPPVLVDDSAGLARYSDTGLPCPSVILDPLALFSDLVSAFDSYLRDLRNRSSVSDDLRRNFKRKFSTAFGIDIGHATFK